MTDKEAIERCNQLIKVEHANWIGISNQKAIETVLNLIQTQDKVIDLILERQAGSSCLNIYCKKRNKKDKCLECVKEYFINKVETENK